MVSAVPRIGIVSFADSRTNVSRSDAANLYIAEQHTAVARTLAERGFFVSDPQNDAARAAGFFSPITTLAERESVIRQLVREEVEAVVVGAWRWSEPMPVVDLVRSLDVPVALYSHATADFSGYGGLASYGAALWEVAPNRAALVHARFVDELDELVRWSWGACAALKLRRSRLMFWGGLMCMGMEHLQDDTSRLKAWLIGDILSEGQYYLIQRAESILQDGREIREVVDWLRANGATIVYDDKMLTETSLARQIALYLAAEQRIDEIGRDSLAGISILCHNELSGLYGVTPCLIPALVPFGENHRGVKRAIPTTCEGDLKSLITSVLLSYIAPETPAHFGDLREFNNDARHIVLSNCGASSLYYAANSNSAREALPHVTLQHQILGGSGAAVTLRGKAMPATVARLCRVNGKYWMHLGKGESVDITDEMMNNRKWGREYPTVAVDLGVSTRDFARVAASNHYCLIPGDRTAEIKYACAQLGVPVLRVDSAQGIEEAIEKMTADAIG